MYYYASSDSSTPITTRVNDTGSTYTSDCWIATNVIYDSYSVYANDILTCLSKQNSFWFRRNCWFNFRESFNCPVYFNFILLVNFKRKVLRCNRKGIGLHLAKTK